MKRKFKFSVVNPEVCLWPFCLLGEMFAFKLKKLYPWAKTGQIQEFADRTNRVAIDPARFNFIAPGTVKKVLADSGWSERATADIYIHCADLIKFTQGVYRAELAKKTDRELLKLYLIYRKKYVTTYAYGWFPNALEGTEYYFTNLLKKYLAGKIKNHQGRLENYLNILITPIKDSARVKEEIGLLRLGLKAKEKGVKSIEPELNRHYQKYCYIPFGYDGPAWDKKYFSGRLNGMLGENFDFTARLEEMERQKIELEAQRHKIIKEFGLDKDKDYYFLFNLAREVMYAKDYRKDVLYQSHYHLDKLIREIGRRLLLTPIQVKHIMPDEMRRALVERKYSEGELNERIKYSVIWVGDKKLKLYVGQPAKAFVKKYVMPEKKITGVGEFKGECAYRGKVRGIVKLVINSADMAKVEDGDILVSPATNPNLLPAMKKCGAIITDKGGITAHAAIVSRELKKPCIIGTKIATKVLRDGDLVEVDAERGVVIKLNN
ncbi:MAG: PEP-utilizing enzyme [Patescibacteria group bacterium]|nr:PEP-utilizing enzyme [Patescibacteria group bacterium]